MKKIVCAALFLVSFSSFAEVKLSSYTEKKEFEQYLINTDKPATITVKVDVEDRKVDCHGLSERYSKSTLVTGEIIVTKQMLAHTMNMCLPGTDRVETSGISFNVVVKTKYGGSALVLVPSDSKITIESK
ncbi:MAG: hypothetical protein H7177_15100 [Rhizobacter sp.]|nr:hypothetical protein [Bacteriovorax sp.]